MTNILFIDDDDDFRGAISTILTDSGYTVTALRGSQNLDNTLVLNNFSVAILDFFLPLENGIEIAKRITAHPNGLNIKILMISSHDNIRPLIRESSIKDFLPKPLDIDKFLMKVKALA